MRTLTAFVFSVVFGLGLSAQAGLGKVKKADSKPTPKPIVSTNPVINSELEPQPPAVPTSNENTFLEIMKKVFEVSARPNVRGNGTLTFGKADCLAEPGTTFQIDIRMNQILNLEFGDIKTDPDTTVSLAAGDKDIVLALDILMGENCTYNIKGKFLLVNQNGMAEPSNLFLRFKMGLTGEFLKFRLNQLDSKLSPIYKGSAEKTAEYVFRGACVADQELVDYKNVASFSRLDQCEIRVEDGQFKVKIKSAPMSNAIVK